MCLWVFRDKFYSKHPIDHSSMGMCAPSLFIMHTADCSSEDQHLLGEAWRRNESLRSWLSSSNSQMENCVLCSAVIPVSKIILFYWGCLVVQYCYRVCWLYLLDTGAVINYITDKAVFLTSWCSFKNCLEKLLKFCICIFFYLYIQLFAYTETCQKHILSHFITEVALFAIRSHHKHDFSYLIFHFVSPSSQ